MLLLIRIKEYTEFDVTYHPQIIRTKKISKQKPLSIIRDKLQHNRKLSDEECSLLITLPLFKVKESEADLTEEICRYISEKKHCIPQHLYDEMVLAMYLNIEEYVDDEKEEKLLEMINMAESYQGVISEIKNECRLDAEREFIIELLQTFTLEEISKYLHREKSEIEKILRK